MSKEVIKLNTHLQDVMLDIETLGTEPGAVVLSISAVFFDLATGDTGVEFHMNIDLQSSLDSGFQINADTLKWWMAQDQEAIKRVFETEGEHLALVLDEFRKFMEKHGDKETKIWGNGARFDMGLVNDLYLGMHYNFIPWNKFKERDVRTLVDFAPEIKTRVVEEAKVAGEVLHDGLVDCKVQIKYCSEIYKKVTNVKK